MTGRRVALPLLVSEFNAAQPRLRAFVGLHRQRVIGALAEFAGCTAFIGNASQDSRSFVSAALQLGKHSSGVFGCRACIGSGGMCGGSAGIGDESVDTLLQLATSSVSKGSISAGLRGFLFGSIDGLSLGFIPCGLGRAKAFGLHPCGLFHLRAFGGASALLGSQRDARSVETDGLHCCQCAHGNDRTTSHP